MAWKKWKKHPPRMVYRCEICGTPVEEDEKLSNHNWDYYKNQPCQCCGSIKQNRHYFFWEHDDNWDKYKSETKGD